MPDVTLTIGGDASGAVQAAAQAGAALQSIPGGGVAGGWSGLYGEIPAKFAPVGEAFRSVGAATVETTEQFALNRMEAGRLTAVLTQLGVVPPVIGRSLSMLMVSAFNPMTAGFAVAIVAAQGLISVLGKIGEAADKERERVKALGEEYRKLSGSMEEVRRLRGVPGPEGAAQTEQGRQGMENAGVPADVAVQLLRGMAEAKMPMSEAPNVAYGWMDPERRIKDPDKYLAAYRARGAAAADAGAQRGAAWVSTDADARGRIQESQARRLMTPRQQLILDLARAEGVDSHEAERMLRAAEGPSELAGGELGMKVQVGVRSRQTVQRFMAGQGQAGVVYQGIVIHNHAGGDTPNPSTDGPPRGPQ